MTKPHETKSKKPCCEPVCQCGPSCACGPECPCRTSAKSADAKPAPR